MARVNHCYDKLKQTTLTESKEDDLLELGQTSSSDAVTTRAKRPAQRSSLSTETQDSVDQGKRRLKARASPFFLVRSFEVCDVRMQRVTV